MSLFVRHDRENHRVNRQTHHCIVMMGYARTRSWSFSFAPPPTPSSNEADFTEDSGELSPKWMVWKRVGAPGGSECTYIIEYETVQEGIRGKKRTRRHTHARTKTEDTRTAKRRSTKKCCDQCGTWNHIRRLACKNCMANRKEMGKGMMRNV